MSAMDLVVLAGSVIGFLTVGAVVALWLYSMLVRKVMRESGAADLLDDVRKSINRKIR